MLSLLRPQPTLTTNGIAPRPRLRAMLIVIAGMLMVGLGAGGCGGSSRSTRSTPTTAITKAEFVAKANEICGRGDPVLSEAELKLASHPTNAQIAAIVRGTIVPAVEAQISGVRALGAPSGDQATVTSMLKLALADLNRLKSRPTLVTTDVFGGFARLAHPYGLSACAPTS
jgi:hypothetical protein